MSDHFEFERWRGIEANSGRWYRSIELIAVGKNAATFLAIGDTSPFIGIPFAIKVFRRVSNVKSREAFLSEAEILKELDHPCIMRLVDEGNYYNKPFLVADYLPRTLSEVIKNGVSLQLKVSYTLQMLSALEYLASLNPPVIHRDLKPANIFIRGDSCIIGDFGLKKVLWPDDAEDGDSVKMSEGPGMPQEYRTPELVRYYNKESNVDLSKSDIFQLGLTIAELFTGENPLIPVADYSESIKLEKISHIDAGDIGAGISGILQKMLSEDPSQRPDASSLLTTWKTIFTDVVDKHLYLKPFAFVSGKINN